MQKLGKLSIIASLASGYGLLAAPDVEAIAKPYSSESSRLIAQSTRSNPPKLSTGPSDERVSRVKFDRIMQYAIAHQLHQKTMAEIMQAIATQFVGSPYQAGLLDIAPKEKLVVALDKFDCVLFVEAVLAIARGVAVQDYEFQTFAVRIGEQRYRDGQLDGYCSRMHYFSEWISANQARGTVKQITQDLGGIKTSKLLNFMSSNRQKYSQMKSDDTFKCIVQMESRLADLDFIYIPHNKIKQAYSKMQPGDIVAIATKIEGLDFTHTGLVYRNSDRSIGLIHASPSGTVKVSPELQTYVNQVKDRAGIVLVRPIDPR